MIVVMPSVAILKGTDDYGREQVFPAQAMAMVIAEEPDASVARFLGEVRGLHQHWLKNGEKR